jgi:hypothetical protein
MIEIWAQVVAGAMGILTTVAVKVVEHYLKARPPRRQVEAAPAASDEPA